MTEEKTKLETTIDKLEERKDHYSKMRKRLISIIFKKKPTPSREVSS